MGSSMNETEDANTKVWETVLLDLNTDFEINIEFSSQNQLWKDHYYI